MRAGAERKPRCPPHHIAKALCTHKKRCSMCAGSWKAEAWRAVGARAPSAASAVCFPSVATPCGKAECRIDMAPTKGMAPTKRR